MTIDRPRLRRIAERKTAHQIPVCRKCGHSSNFVWNFSAQEPTKTCRECGFVDVIGCFDTKKEVAA